jgi:DNA gyrase subunit A
MLTQTEKELTPLANAVLVVTKKGMGKVTTIDEFQVRGRGGKGVAGMKVTDESGPVADAVGVTTGTGQSVLLLTKQGMALRISVDDITARSRTAGGVKLMTVADGDAIACVSV